MILELMGPHSDHNQDSSLSRPSEMGDNSIFWVKCSLYMHQNLLIAYKWTHKTEKPEYLKK